MGHSPNIGREAWQEFQKRDAPGPAETIGTVKDEVLNPPPRVAAWALDTGDTIEIEDQPPPWEVDPDHRRDNTDARTFVRVPDNWELRWVSQRLLEVVGERDWRPVLASNPKVTVLVPTMVTPEGYIRMGGKSGDLLFWMPRHWWESRQRQKAEHNQRLTQRAVDQQQELKENIRRSPAGRYISIEEAKHPSHTIGDGRTMTD